jgi:hypothetical protein
MDVTIRFQTSKLYNVGEKPGPRGFLAYEGTWSHCYGTTLKSDYATHDARKLQRALRLIDRARAKAPNVRCELLSLMIGLQRCGVEVQVWSATLDKIRASRTTLMKAA